MATKDKLVFSDKAGNMLYTSKEGFWYGRNKDGKQINLNEIIILVERAGFNIERLEKINGKIMLLMEDEAVEKDLT